MLKNRRLNRSAASKILLIYLISLFCTVAMFMIKSDVRYVFCAAAFVGYVAVCVMVILKLVRYFKDRKKAGVKPHR